MPKANGAMSKYAAADGKHYWNCWTNNYRPAEDGYITHAFCEEDKGPRALCGAKTVEGGGLSIPHDIARPGCIKCHHIMKKRGALLEDNGESN
jgi:hypothetical protein